MKKEKSAFSQTKQDAPRLLSDADLDKVNGGMLLPAVNQAREAARRMHSATENSDSFNTK